MKHLIIFTIITQLFISTMLSAIPLTQTDKENLQKRKIQEHILFENYLETDKGITSVFGYHFDTYLKERWFFTLAIFGAIGGERGGYGIAAFGGGYAHPVTKKLTWDTRLLTGSGGGGGLAAGGGFLWEIQTGPSYEFHPNIFAEIKYGYLQFPTGDFETPILNFGISVRHLGIFLPYTD